MQMRNCQRVNTQIVWKFLTANAIFREELSRAKKWKKRKFPRHFLILSIVFRHLAANSLAAKNVIAGEGDVRCGEEERNGRRRGDVAGN